MDATGETVERYIWLQANAYPLSSQIIVAKIAWPLAHVDDLFHKKEHTQDEKDGPACIGEHPAEAAPRDDSVLPGLGRSIPKIDTRGQARTLRCMLHLRTLPHN